MGLFSSILAKLGVGTKPAPAPVVETPAPVAEAPAPVETPVAPVEDAVVADAPADVVETFDTPVDEIVADPVDEEVACVEEEAAPAPEPEPVPEPAPVVDVVATLEKLAKANSEDLDWKKSIVDLLKLLNLDSSLHARKEMAVELGCPKETMSDSAEMNMWLHKVVLTKIAENGGNIPTHLFK